MKLKFQVADVGDNIYHAFPKFLEACCNQSLLWFMRTPKSWNVVNSFIIQQVDEKTTENFYYCQFCGQKHEAEELKEEPKV